MTHATQQFRRVARWSCVLLLTTCPPLAQAQTLRDAPPIIKPTLVATQSEIDSALHARKFHEALALIDGRLASGVTDPLLHYNAACCLAQLGELPEAERRLLACVSAGFRDFDLMEADPDLEPIRASTTYEAIFEARERVESKTPRAPGANRSRRSAPDPLVLWKAAHGDNYRYDRDEDGNLVYATILEPQAHARMKAMLSELQRHLLKAYFLKPSTTPVLVAIVRPEDAKAYLDRPEIKGMYLHRERRLVARDTGQSLQHEFVHLAHYAHMDRLGQRHPMWVQEGLASLYEDYQLKADGRIEFHPNIRFNLARKQVTSNTARAWKDLVSLSSESFMDDAERLYPQTRAMFEFFARERKLEDFYRALCDTFAADPDGSSAIERAFGEPLSKVEARWRKWMIERGAVDDSVTRGDASLGFTADEAVDGVKVRSFVPRSAAKAAGIRVNDVILSIDGVPVRNRDELMLAVARLALGRAIEVRYRRDAVELAVQIVPRPLGQ